MIEFDDGSGSVLRIQPLRAHRDEAIYECTATNSMGEINTSAKLTVLEGEGLPPYLLPIPSTPLPTHYLSPRSSARLQSTSGWAPAHQLGCMSAVLVKQVSERQHWVPSMLSSAVVDFFVWKNVPVGRLKKLRTTNETICAHINTLSLTGT